ncbi:hypothetical protein ACMZ49_10085 [Alcaligenes phenolicus]
MTSTDQQLRINSDLVNTALSLNSTVGSHSVQITALEILLSALLDEAATDPQRAEQLRTLINQKVRSHTRFRGGVSDADEVSGELTQQLRRLLPKSLHPEPLDL